MAKSLALLCSCLALALMPAACGDDEEEGDGGQAQPEEQGGGGSGKTAAVSMTVSRGDTVTWTNEESFPHDVTKREGPGSYFSSGESGGMAEGDTFSHTFDTPGKVEYVCTVHANMRGTVTVK